MGLALRLPSSSVVSGLLTRFGREGLRNIGNEGIVGRDAQPGTVAAVVSLSDAPELLNLTPAATRAAGYLQILGSGKRLTIRVVPLDTGPCPADSGDTEGWQFV